jgi:hypothetical protein
VERLFKSRGGGGGCVKTARAHESGDSFSLDVETT